MQLCVTKALTPSLSSGKSSAHLAWMRTSCKEMISRALGPCSHGWVDECASPPHLVTRPLLQSPADVLKTQQSVLTVFPRVRPHPFVSLFNIVSMGINKSQHHSRESLNLVCSSKHWKIRWEHFWEQIWILLPRAESAIKGSLVSLFIWLFPLSDIASDADTEVKSQSTLAQTNGFSLVHLFAFYSHWDRSTPQIVKSHWYQTIDIDKNKLLEIKKK